MLPSDLAFLPVFSYTRLSSSLWFTLTSQPDTLALVSTCLSSLRYQSTVWLKLSPCTTPCFACCLPAIVCNLSSDSLGSTMLHLNVVHQSGVLFLSFSMASR